MSFCLEDTLRVTAGDQPGLHPNCESPVMGISRTWADFYNAGLPGQEFDVAGLAAGTYYVVLRVDPMGNFLQTRTDNDVVWTRIMLDPASGRTYPTGYSE